MPVEPGEREAQMNHITAVLAVPGNFSSCIEGDYKVVSSVSLFSLPPASWMVILLLLQY